MSEHRSWWHPLWEFFTHLIVGTGLFLLLTIPAVGLNLLIKWLSKIGIDGFVINVLIAAEYAILVADVLFLAVFLVKATYRAAKNI